MQKRNSVTLR
uniref:Uncharacterized protein n=1 Tax=Arundo donax TaxID=35708 RepID=A0A0A9C5P3_ARUDO